MFVLPRLAAYPDVERAVWPVVRARLKKRFPVNVALREAAEAMNVVVDGSARSDF